MKKEHLIVLAALLAGVILAPTIRRVPLLDKLPSVG